MNILADIARTEGQKTALTIQMKLAGDWDYEFNCPKSYVKFGSDKTRSYFINEMSVRDKVLSKYDELEHKYDELEHKYKEPEHKHKGLLTRLWEFLI